MAYYSPRMSSSGSSESDFDRSHHIPPSSASAGPSRLGSAFVEAPQTPPSVRDVSSSLCLQLGQFRELLRQYRAIDDGLNTRMNRTLARYRDQGSFGSPTLLSDGSKGSHTFTTRDSARAKDLGTSTYSVAPNDACATFWKELSEIWAGRDEVIRYCVAVADRHAATQLGGSASGSQRLAQRDRDSGDWLLDADAQPPRAVEQETRMSRSESGEEVLRRQLRQELDVERVIRQSSVQAFKSRCRFFQPTITPGERGERERAIWEGRDVLPAPRRQPL